MSQRLRFTPVEHLPDFLGKKGPHETEVTRALKAVRDAPSHIIEVQGDGDEVTRFYKSMVQWRNRHRADFPQLRVARQADRVFVWLETGDTAASLSPRENHDSVVRESGVRRRDRVAFAELREFPPS
jgi:hypothetical protein